MENQNGTLTLEQFKRVRYQFQFFFLDGQHGDDARERGVYQRWVPRYEAWALRLSGKYRAHPFGHDDLEELYDAYRSMREHAVSDADLFEDSGAD
jgi:hypothetical protein